MDRFYLARSAAPLVAALLAAAGAAATVSTQDERRSTERPAEDKPEPGPSKFEGAVGLTMSIKPEFSGAPDDKNSLKPAGFLRWGRFTITGSGGFVTRRADETFSGLEAELVRKGGLRLTLAARYDQGRPERNSALLSGLGDLRPTVRGRLGLRWEPARHWSVQVTDNFDLLNRVGGHLLEAGVSREIPVNGRQRFVLAAGLAAADSRYLQAWYGITPEQSLASTGAYPVYRPGAGLREAHLSATWRVEIDRQWAAFAGASARHLMGPAAASPLVVQPNALWLQTGLARRF